MSEYPKKLIELFYGDKNRIIEFESKVKNVVNKYVGMAWNPETKDNIEREIKVIWMDFHYVGHVAVQIMPEFGIWFDYQNLSANFLWIDKEMREETDMTDLEKARERYNRFRDYDHWDGARAYITALEAALDAQTDHAERMEKLLDEAREEVARWKGIARTLARWHENLPRPIDIEKARESLNRLDVMEDIRRLDGYHERDHRTGGENE